jgi:hypothetical protein
MMHDAENMLFVALLALPLHKVARVTYYWPIYNCLTLYLSTSNMTGLDLSHAN